MSGKDNLIPQNRRTKEEQREIAKMGGIASGKARAEKKRISEIYADFLANEHEINIDGLKQKYSGTKLVSMTILKILESGGSPSVSMMKEIREATEGSKLDLSGEFDITVKYMGIMPLERNSTETSS